ncbi:MAG: hypothetical protein KAG97_01455 [Victivallales bacterium]|nr:hypothetical protein [Victivallales bacterium]
MYSTVKIVNNRHFRRLVLSLAFFATFLLVFTVRAQIAVSMGLDRKGYVRYERILAKVAFRNYTGRSLAFGKTKDLRGSISFLLIAPNGKRLKLRKGNFNYLEGKILKPGATEQIIVPVSDMYNVTKPGSYSLHAVISHPILSSAYKSNETSFSVFNGIVVWKRLVGVPDVLNERPGKKIKSREVKILNFYDGMKKLYALKIEDAEYVYALRRLQEDVDSDMPDVEIDGLSKVHIFIQISAKVFVYFVYDLNGNLVSFDRYRRDASGNPRLVRDKQEGTISIMGGVRALKGRDFTEENPNPIFQE